jgi:hypothetical protein
MYLDAMLADASGPRHQVFGLSVENGAVLTGFPIDVGDVLRARGISFAPRVQNQRGALLIAHDTLFIPYGGHFGDCGNYHGWLVGIPLGEPRRVIAWHTRADKGGIWAPGGVVWDDHSLFAATGNTFDTEQWGDGDAVIRFTPDLKTSSSKKDYFAPRNWLTLDDEDADLGGTNPLPIDVRTPNGTRHLMLALGKDAKAYLLDRDNLGGIGGALTVEEVARERIITAPATYPGPDGSAMVAFQGLASECPETVTDPRLTVLKLSAVPSPSITIAWCGSLNGAGSPIVTTTDGSSDPIVWITGAEGDERLHAFRADDGEELLKGQQPEMNGLQHFGTIVATRNRLYIPADGRIYAFTP